MTLVTRGNWEEESRRAKAHIAEAAFVAIDCELSGVETTGWRAGTQVDTLETRYLNLRDAAQKFGLLQFGICPFVCHPSGAEFVAHPYTFCLFPRNELPVELPARDFLCQATSLEFLSKHGFDFNTWVYDGISFLSREQEAEARTRLGLNREAQSEDHPEQQHIPLVRTADVVFTEKVRVEIGEWRDGAARDKEDDAPFHLIDVRSNYEANLVHQVVRKNFGDLVLLSDQGGNKVKVLLPRSTEERAALLELWERDRRARIEAQIFEAVGFRHIIDELVVSRKPIVGHNCFLDLAQMFTKFFGPLPTGCAHFCASIRQHFECIVDTKILLKSGSPLTTSTVLGAAYEQLRGSSEVKVEMFGSRYTGDADLEHEAGYDAYMTGFIFASICNKLNFTSFQRLPEEAKHTEAGIPGCANLLFLGYLSPFVLDLATGKEAAGLRALKAHREAKGGPRSERAALVWGFSKVHDVRKQVTNSFKGTGHIPDFELVPLKDEDSAFFVFKSKQSMEALVGAFENGGRGRPGSSLQVCNVEKLVLAGLKVARFDAFEKLCRSPLSTAKLGESAQLVIQEQEPQQQPKRELVVNGRHVDASSDQQQPRKKARQTGL